MSYKNVKYNAYRDRKNLKSRDRLVFNFCLFIYFLVIKHLLKDKNKNKRYTMPSTHTTLHYYILETLTTFHNSNLH